MKITIVSSYTTLRENDKLNQVSYAFKYKLNALLIFEFKSTLILLLVIDEWLDTKRNVEWFKVRF